MASPERPPSGSRQRPCGSSDRIRPEQALASGQHDYRNRREWTVICADDRVDGGNAARLNGMPASAFMQSTVTTKVAGPFPNTARQQILSGGASERS
jgi:hypothetical protein